jgi:hypothetical protein
MMNLRKAAGTTATVKFDVERGSRLFSAVVFSVFGWTIVTAWNLRFGAGLLLHAITALSGACLTIASFRRYRLLRAPPVPAAASEEAPTTKPTCKLLDAACGALLAVSGYALAWAMLAGSFALFGIFALILSHLPWLKMGFCRRHLFFSCVMIETGAACALLPALPQIDPMLFPIATWFLWLIATMELFRELFTQIRRSGAKTTAAHVVRDLEQV